jgi:hypothetical protein
MRIQKVNMTALYDIEKAAAAATATCSSARSNQRLATGNHNRQQTTDLSVQQCLHQHSIFRLATKEIRD